jgi:hypothetical protein
MLLPPGTGALPWRDLMQRLYAITWLTWKAAFRFRLFWVLGGLLLLCVVGLPVMLEDDGTARGFTQIVLTYTLTSISALLGLSTLWISCGTLARDIEECQMQVVAVKPIARWQIWLGKWLGIVSLNALLLVLSGGAVYGLLQWRATRLPEKEQTTLRNEVLVARGSAREKSYTTEIETTTDAILKDRLAKSPVSTVDLPQVRKQILEQVKAEYQIVPPSYMKVWQIDLGPIKDKIRGKPLQLRIKFNSADLNSFRTYSGLWQIGVPQKTQVWRSEPMSLAAETFHEFEIPADLFEDNGLLTINFVNPNDIALLFPLEDGMEVLYPIGGFTGSYIRGLGVILCWMALLATVGLTTSSFLSFPVAAFVSLGMLTMTLSSGTMAGAVSEGTIGGYNPEKGARDPTPVDFVIIPTFRAALSVINLAKDFSPVDSLSTGRSVGWDQLARAVTQVVVLLGGMIGLGGVYFFHRRELATAQGTQ